MPCSTPGGTRRLPTTARWKRFRIDIGTAANVQAMVFGNMGDTSGTGVGFTRDPGTGEKVFYGEFLVNAQGEDVVAGIRTPQPISELEKSCRRPTSSFARSRRTSKSTINDMQDFEFTIEEGKLYMLQTRNGKRTGPAAVRDRGGHGGRRPDHEEEAVLRVAPKQLDQLLHPVFDPPCAEEAARRSPRVSRPRRARPSAASRSRPKTRSRCRRRRSRDPGPQGNHAGRHPRHGRREGHSDGGRRKVQPRGRRRARHGTALHRRRGVDLDRRARKKFTRHRRRQEASTVKEGDWISLDGTTGEVYLGQAKTKRARSELALTSAS